jgi:phosphomannomutase
MTKIKLSELVSLTGVGFGTSGIRDLIEKLTDKTVYLYTKAFIGHLRTINDLKNNTIAVAGDLRSSTPRISVAVIRAIIDEGLNVVYCGNIPTPAITYFGLVKKCPTVMVTGSHIPDNRNGIKYQLSTKEILKSDEDAITSSEVEYDSELFDGSEMFAWQYVLPEVSDEGKNIYIQRYVNIFGGSFLYGKNIGVWGHSAVGREIYVELLTKMGGTVKKIDYSNGIFVPVDTDSVNEDTVSKMRGWCHEFDLDYVMSTDGDGDRPLLTDETGVQVRSELLPLLTARYFVADAIAVTLTTCTVAERTGWFKKVIRTKVGSPNIVAAMEELEDEGYRMVMGYELNGGFMANDLRTRDALMPIFGSIAYAIQQHKPLSVVVDELPKRFTYSSSIKGIPTDLSLNVIDNWEIKREEIENMFSRIIDVNLLDGLRLTFDNDEIVHFRPSKNAPEFRNYTEADTYDRARVLSEKSIELIKKWTDN